MKMVKEQRSLHIKKSYSATTTGDASTLYPGKRMTYKNMTEV